MRKQFLLIGIAVLLASRIFAENVERNSDPVLERVEQSLGSVLEVLDPQPSVEYKETSNSLIVGYRTRTFIVHSGSKIGRFSEQAHETIGPDYDGFVLKVHVQEVGTVNQAETPQTIRQPYWKSDLDVTPITGTSEQIYWVLSYGSKPDIRVLSRIRNALRKLEDTDAGVPSGKGQTAEHLPVERLDELTGVFKKNIKALSPYMLQIDGGGPMYLRGNILKTVPDGTCIWVSGRIHSIFYDNSSDPRPAMMPRQWHIFMQVEEYKKTSKPFELPERVKNVRHSSK